MSNLSIIELQTKLGNICGRVSEINGTRVAKFLGVPYAKQPVGNLRFKPLELLQVPIGTHDSPYEAFKVGSSPLQNTKLAYGTELAIGEDCIYLNIFMPLEESNDLKHVFFHIHGGWFHQGSGGEPMYDMSYFAATHDAVCVSVNYRLGVLGFLSLTPVIEDNLGLKDQQVALKWVREHIGSFGGDPEKVTIYGCSSGGASCHYHLMNAESSRLFKRAILSSGTATYNWSMITPAEQQQRVQSILSLLGCPSDLTKSEILSFLQEVEPEKFSGLLTKLKHYSKFPMPVNTFCLNRDSRKPVDRKPILIGTTVEEGNILTDQFFPGNKRAPHLTWARGKLAIRLGEDLFYEPFRSLRKEISSIEDYPIFCYFFDYETQSRSDTAYPEWFCGLQHGKTHTSDIPFFFAQNCSGSALMPNASEQDDVVNKAMGEMVGKFMKNPVNEIGLPVYSPGNPVVTRINREGLKEDNNCKFKLCKKIQKPQYKLANKLVRKYPNSF